MERLNELIESWGSNIEIVKLNGQVIVKTTRWVIVDPLRQSIENLNLDFKVEVWNVY